jgi:hypothetical protein
MTDSLSSVQNIYCTIPTNSDGHCHQGVRPPDFRPVVIGHLGSAARFGLMSSRPKFYPPGTVLKIGVFEHPRGGKPCIEWLQATHWIQMGLESCAGGVHVWDCCYDCRGPPSGTVLSSSSGPPPLGLTLTFFVINYPPAELVGMVQ